jgi:hypothetical protein
LPASLLRSCDLLVAALLPELLPLAYLLLRGVRSHERTLYSSKMPSCVLIWRSVFRSAQIVQQHVVQVPVVDLALQQQMQQQARTCLSSFAVLLAARGALLIRRAR